MRSIRIRYFSVVFSSFFFVFRTLCEYNILRQIHKSIRFDMNDIERALNIGLEIFFIFQSSSLHQKLCCAVPIQQANQSKNRMFYAIKYWLFSDAQNMYAKAKCFVNEKASNFSIGWKIELCKCIEHEHATSHCLHHTKKHDKHFWNTWVYDCCTHTHTHARLAETKKNGRYD